MRETKTEIHQVHFQMRHRTYQAFRSRAEKEDMTISDLARGYIKQGLAIHNFMDKGGKVILRYPDGTEQIMKR